MKKISLLFLLMSFFFVSNAQDYSQDQTLFERLTNIEKRNDWFNFYLNMHGSFDASFNYNRDGLDEAAFKMKQFRIEARGNVTDWLSYRWRQRLNRGNAGGGNIDNMPTSIDIAGIGVKLNDHWSFFAGKQCAAYGGIEFDLNPIEIYEYTDMVEYMDNFMTGLNIAFKPCENHELQFQILNALNSPFHEYYGNVLGQEEARAPLLYTLNWNGSLFNNVLNTRWSASIMNQSNKKEMYYFALGNEVTVNNFNMFFDFMYALQGIDRKGIITDIVEPSYGGNALNAEYLSLVAKFNYRVAPKWNVFLEGMYETASVSKERAGIEKGKYRTSYGYLGGIEYYPMKSDLHFYAAFVGRSYDYTKRAGDFTHDTQRLEVGFIYQLPMF